MDIDEYRRASFNMGTKHGLMQGLVFGIPIGALVGMALMYYGVV